MIIRGAKQMRVLVGLTIGLVLVGCSDPGGNPDTADSANCDHGYLCGAYVDGDGDGGISSTEWSEAYRRADANGDGQLSQSEFAAAGGNWGSGRGGR